MPAGTGRNGDAQSMRVATLRITYDTFTARLEIDGETASADEAINMLHQAARAMEDQRRIAVMQAMTAQVQEAATLARVRDDLQRRN